MTTRADLDSTYFPQIQHRHRKVTKNAVSHSSRTLPILIDIHQPDLTLSPNDELECRQMYEKLQRLQPNGVCADLNTLRRALYPPSPLTKNTEDHLLAFKSYRRR